MLTCGSISELLPLFSCGETGGKVCRGSDIISVCKAARQTARNRLCIPNQAGVITLISEQTLCLGTFIDFSAKDSCSRHWHLAGVNLRSWTGNKMDTCNADFLTCNLSVTGLKYMKSTDCVSLLFLPGCSALSEMESVLLTVAKERKAQRKQTVFVDSLLQSSLTERQVNTDEVSRSGLKPEASSQFLQRSENEMKCVVCFRLWRTAWFSHWLDASSLPTVRNDYHSSWRSVLSLSFLDLKMLSFSEASM